MDGRDRTPLVYAVLNFSPACIKVPTVVTVHYSIDLPFSLYRLLWNIVKLLVIIETPMEGLLSTLHVLRAQLIVSELFSLAKSECILVKQ